MSKSHLISIVLATVIIFSACSVFGDTVYFNNHKLEGRIVEETPAHVVIETPIGKATITKDRITKIERLSQEENFLEMGDDCFKQKRYDAAIDYYNKALEVNPEYEKAKEALAKAKEIKEEIAQRRKLELERLRKEREKKKEKLEKKIGMVVDEINGKFEVVNVVKGSPSDHAQIKLHDRLITIGGSSTKGMTLEEVWEKLSGKKPISLTIEREAEVLRKRVEYRKRSFVGIGIFLDTDNKGLFVSSVIEGESADKAGLAGGDRIISINGKSTKDLGLDEAAELISDGELTKVNIVARRDIKIK